MISPLRWLEWLIRIFGAGLVCAAAAGTPFVLWKLYTGRHAETPIRAAIQEQPLILFVGVCALGVGAAAVLKARAIVAGRRWLNPAWLLRHRRRELALLVASSLACFGLLEVASRALFARQYGFPFRHSVEELIYPPLREQFQAQPYSKDSVNILLLGGSVLWGAGNQHRLEHTFDYPLHVYNMAQTGHSSLDSLNKCLWLSRRGYTFDYVIFYHGINETRANNAPPDVFSEDYDHYSFYRLTNTVFQGQRPVQAVLLRSSLCFRIYRLWATLRETRTFGRRYLHIAFPREDWLKYAADVRSADSFRRNLERIIALADEQGSTLIVPFFAYNPVMDKWVASRAFREEGKKRMTEWGLTEYVRKGTQEHNAVIVSLRDRFVYADDTKRLMDDEANFVDDCHFAPEIQDAFLEILMAALRRVERPHEEVGATHGG